MRVFVNGHWAERTFYLLLMAAGAYLLWFFITADFRRVLLVTPDDAYYYLETANNLAAGQGLSFDSITRTNGFQPLWLGMLVPLYAVIHATPEMMTRLVLIGQLATLLLSGALLFEVLKRLLSPGAALAAGLVFIVWGVVPSLNGMESGALIGALIALFYYGWRKDVFGNFRPGTSFVFGILLGVVALARLDTVFLIAAILAMAGLPVFYDRERRGLYVRRVLCMVAGLLLIISPYLWYNHTVFGALMPISGQLKSTFPQISLTRDGLWKVSKAKLIIGILAFLYVIYHAVRHDWRRTGSAQWYLPGAMLAMAIYVTFHLLHTLLFMHWGVYNWHFIAYNLFFAVLAAIGIERARGRIRGAGAALPVGAAALLVAAGVVQFARYADGVNSSPFNGMTYDAALWARANSGPEAVFALRDAGVFGYFSRRNTINLDGLVNDREYQEVLRRQELRGYLAERDVDYLVVHAYSDYPKIAGNYGTFRLRYWSRLHKLWSDELALPQSNEVYRSPVYYDGIMAKPCALVIWKWDG